MSSTTSEPSLTTSTILRFWIPLCATWLMMAVESPILTSVIARLDVPMYNLAAYGVAVALAMFIEAPVIMLLSTSVALAKDRLAVEALRAFTRRINIIVTVGMIVVCIPPVYDLIVHQVIRIPDEVSRLMYRGLVCMIPWPAAIGYRRFYQGLLIRNGFTRRVAYGTVVRLFTMAFSASVLVLFSPFDGVVIGTVSLTSGVILEAWATRWMARSTLRALRRQDPAACAPPPTTRDILRFYMPLALTSIVGFVVTPMLAFFMGRARLPVESLAVLPVVDSFVFLFRSFGFSYQEVGIALLGEGNRHYTAIRKVGVMIIVGTTVALGLVAFTPLSEVIYAGVYGLKPELADFAVEPTMILILLPMLSVLYSLQRAVLITARRNVAVTWSTITEVSCIAATMILTLWLFDLPGAMAAALAMVVGRVIANIYLRREVSKALKMTPR
ncbi:MAG: hypothetical protein J0I17_04500 ['Candidatus Kapabacteria' thiocyanatum]|uniref:Polysaccharide biosynthesis protein C-terminal domain-containing protein n=1 Tax=Candidatus Kapaibacterium thiocyanatum TaxID=1895771 RepID=A0A1M3L5Q0_9BACT|nr:hypothetical protein ['Candidatus Kapabacteria' thiocyanatum]OJX60881.1 MAG: hypothetical protein BGO89_04775 ['Candidatus Kapabacteria' thiocyanatum]